MKYPFFIFILSIPIILSGCSETTPLQLEKYYSIYDTKSGSIVLSDELAITLEGEKTSDLAFRSAGIVSEILVIPGEKVKKGQILARLSNQESNIQVTGLRDLRNSLDILESTTIGVKSSTIDTVGAVMNLYNERIRSIDVSLKTLEKNIESARLGKNNQEQAALDTLLAFGRDFDRISTNMLYEGDKILGMTIAYEYTNDGWEPYLGARVGSALSPTKNSWNATYSARGNIRKYSEDGSPLPSRETLMVEIESSLKTAREYAKNMDYLLKNSPVGGDLSEERLEGWISVWDGLRSTIEGLESRYIIWKSETLNLTNLGTSGATIEEKKIDALLLEYENLKQSKNILIAEKEAKIAEIRANTEAIEAKRGEVNVKVTETKMNTLLAIESLEYNIIRAPFDGVILEKYFEEGVMIGAGTPLLRMSSSSAPFIKTYIDNSLYGYSLGESLMIFGEDSNTWTGTITLIQEQKDPLHGKNYVEIRIDGEAPLGSKGTLLLYREKSTLVDGTLIPIESIINRYGPSGVFLIEDEKIKFQMIEIVRSDERHAEVLGIPPSAKIIVEGKEHLYDGEELGKRLTLH